MNAPNSWEGLTSKQTILYSLGAIVSFHLAYSFSQFSFLIAVYLFCLFRLANLNTPRKAFYIGFFIGMAIFASHLGFFWNIFHATAIALWAVLAFWIGLFLLLSQAARKRFGPKVFALLVPFLWLGLEYFRSELYYLRFSWMNVGYAFYQQSEIINWFGGVYGVGFLLMALVSCVSLIKTRFPNLFLIGGILSVMWFIGRPPDHGFRIPNEGNGLSVAGVQMEFPTEAGVTFALNRLVEKYPEAELLVLSEYTFDGPVPEKIKTWCQENEKYLIVGGKEPLPNDEFYNTAFVIDPNGEIIFQQVKSVPIQFFKDGLPAPEQNLWKSPWGKIGICICYDLSYRKVVDRLVKQGAEALVVPMMDVAEWGKNQHELHSRVPPVRAAEYGIPIFRVASSGISQLVNRDGIVEASAPFPGDEAMLAGKLQLREKGHLPIDHWLAPLSVGVTGIVIVFLGINAMTPKRPSKNSRAATRT